MEIIIPERRDFKMLVERAGKPKEAHLPSVTPRATSPVYTLVVHSNVTKQVSHRLSIVDTADGLSQDHTDIHRLDFWTLELLHFMRDCIGHHHLKIHQIKIIYFQ